VDAAAGGGAVFSVSDRVQPFITAAAPTTALRMMNFRRSKPAGISDGTCAGGSSGPRSSSLASSLLDMAFLQLLSGDEITARALCWPRSIGGS
jgi:hypothetical protein